MTREWTKWGRSERIGCCLLRRDNTRFVHSEVFPDHLSLIRQRLNTIFKVTPIVVDALVFPNPHVKEGPSDHGWVWSNVKWGPLEHKSLKSVFSGTPCMSPPNVHILYVPARCSHSSINCGNFWPQPWISPSSLIAHLSEETYLQGWGF